MALTAKAILKEIDCPFLDLYKIVGHGYWLFTYTDDARGIFETRSVLCPRLGDMQKSQWVRDGKTLIAAVEEKRPC